MSKEQFSVPSVSEKQDHIEQPGAAITTGPIEREGVRQELLTPKLPVAKANLKEYKDEQAKRMPPVDAADDAVKALESELSVKGEQQLAETTDTALKSAGVNGQLRMDSIKLLSLGGRDLRATADIDTDSTTVINPQVNMEGAQSRKFNPLFAASLQHLSVGVDFQDLAVGKKGAQGHLQLMMTANKDVDQDGADSMAAKEVVFQGQYDVAIDGEKRRVEFSTTTEVTLPTGSSAQLIYSAEGQLRFEI